MKHIALLIIFLNIFAVEAKDLYNKSLHLSPGWIAIEAVPFKIESINTSPQNIVRIEKTDGKLIRFIALKTGIAKVTINGIEKKQNYTVIVTTDFIKNEIQKALNKFGRELDMFPEINTEFHPQKGIIIVRGEICNLETVNRKNKLIKKYDAILKKYKLTVKDKTTYIFQK